MSILSSISRDGKYEPFELQVARGQIAGHSVVTIFGYNADVDTTEESVWMNGGTIPHPVSASVLKISSGNAADTSAGTGARSVFIAGVDENYNTVSETVTLNGQTEVNTVNSYRGLNQFYVTSVGSGGENAGNINAGTGIVTAGVPAVLYDIIGTGNNNRTTAHYIVPAGYTAYMLMGMFSAGQVSGSTSITGKLQTMGTDFIVRTAAIVTMNNGSTQYDFTVPIVIPEKTCVGAVAAGSSSNNSVSTVFNMILIKNDGQS